MVMRLTLFIIIITQAHRAVNSPLRIKRSPRDLGTLPTQTILVPIQNTGTRVIPVFASNAGKSSGTYSTSVLPQEIIFKNKGHNVPLIAPIPLSQFYYHSKVHVIPRPNIIQSAIQHVTKDNIKIPVISHHSVSHSSPNANVTHSSSVIPVLIPIHGHISDLSVIPLQRNQEKNRYRLERNREEDDKPFNQYQNFYGGHGTGLFFGGHGSGHGFYAYGK